MNIIKLLVASYLILSTFIEWNIIHCMEEKESSYDIGARYYEGIGAEPDKVEAAKWFRRAAEEDRHITAQFRLAICYELGDGVNQDKAEFAKWLQKAAEQEHIIAQFRTGVCYEKGEGVIQDKAEALKWFQKAADQGNLPAKQRVIKLESELFGYSSTADQLNSAQKPNANKSKTQAGTTNKKFADKGNSINNTNPISSQSHKKHPRQNNQKQNSQNNLSPEEYKKAEEAARKAMDELIAEEEAELRKRKQPRGNSKKVNGKGNEGIKKEEKKEPISTKQITSLKKATERLSGSKSDQVSSTKISAVDKVPTITHSPQAQKHDNASEGKQKGQQSNTTQATQAVNIEHILASPETQKEATNTVGKEKEKKGKEKKEPSQTAQITSLKEASEKPSIDKPGQLSNTKTSAVDKVPTITRSSQTQKQDNASQRNQKGQQSNTIHATQAVNDNHILTSPETQKEAANIIEEKGDKKEEKKGKTAPTKQIKGAEKPVEKPSVDKLSQASSTKISAVDKVPTITRSSQTQKQGNASTRKQKGQQSNTTQATQAVNNEHILASPESQSKATSTVEKEGDKKEEEKGKTAPTKHITNLKEAPEKLLGNKPGQVFNTKISAVDKPSPITHSPQKQKQNNASKGKQDGQLGSTIQTTQAINNNRIFTYREKQIKPTNNVGKQKVICNNSTADTNEGETKAIIDIDAHQLLQVDNQPGSIIDHQFKPTKKKSSKTLWSDVKGILKKKKHEKEDEAEKEIKAENTITTMNSQILYHTIANPNAHTNGETGKTSYYTGQIRYIQVPVPFPVHVKIPVYIPVPLYFPHLSGNKSQPWIPHTQIKYEDGKKIVTQWSDEGSGSIHIYHPDSDNMELEYSCLDTRLRYLKSILKMHGSQIEDKDQCDKTDSSSPHIIHHGGEAAKQNNEELKKEICKLEKIIQEKNLELPK